MDVAVTGLGGKVGRAFIEYGNRNRELNVRGLTRTPFPKTPLVEIIHGNLFDINAQLRLLKDREAVFHFAADTSTFNGREHAASAILTNAVGTANLVNLLNERSNKPRLIYLSTAHIYHLSASKPEVYDENGLEIEEPLRKWLENAKCFFSDMVRQRGVCDGEAETYRVVHNFLDLNPVPWEGIENNYGYPFVYEVSKLLGELFVIDYEHHFIVRPTYLYGPTDRENEVATLFDNYFQKGLIRIWQEGRDFMHYKDFINLVLTLGTRPESELLAVAPNRLVNGCTGRLVDCGAIQNLLAELDYCFKHASSMEMAPRKRDAVRISNARALILSDGMRKKELTTAEEGFREMLYKAIIDNVVNGRIVSHLMGGSAAHVYLVGNERGLEIFKIATVEGAENGIEKISAEIRHAEAMSRYLEERPGIGHKGLALKFSSSHSSRHLAFFTSKYLEGKNMGSSICDDDMDAGTALRLICKLQDVLLDVYSAEMMAPPENFFDRAYTGRVIRRLNGVVNVDASNGSDFFEHLLDVENITINGVQYKNPLKIINDIKNDDALCRMLSPKQLGVCVSGDAIPDNVIIDQDGFYIIDPRGDVIWGRSKVTGKQIPFYDPLYDIGKMLFYFSGWKMIREELFDLDFKCRQIEKNGGDFQLQQPPSHMMGTFKEIQSGFLPVSLENGLLEYIATNDDSTLRLAFITATHFLADAHPRMVGQGKRKREQALATYLIGTVMLNRFEHYLKTSKPAASFGEQEFRNVVLWQDKFLGRA